MKHLLNDLSEQERNGILEQYSGKMTVDTTKFKKLLESKLGDAKPLVMEQEDVNVETILSDEGLGGESEQVFCSPSTPPPLVQKLIYKIPSNIKEEAIQTIKKLANVFKNLSIKDLLNLRRQVKGEKQKAEQKQQMNEQLVPIVIAGISVSPLILIAIAAILIIIIVSLIISKSGKSKKRRGSCNPGWWDRL